MKLSHVRRNPVDHSAVGILFDHDDSPAERHTVVPVVSAEHGDGDARVPPDVLEPGAAFVHVDEHAAVLPEVPGL
jgi:hypothetical protein